MPSRHGTGRCRQTAGAREQAAVLVVRVADRDLTGQIFSFTISHDFSSFMLFLACASGRELASSETDA